MIQQAEGVMYAKLRALNTKVSTLALRIRTELGNEALLTGMGEDTVKALYELAQAMEHYSSAVRTRFEGDA